MTNKILALSLVLGALNISQANATGCASQHIDALDTVCGLSKGGEIYHIYQIKFAGTCELNNNLATIDWPFNPQIKAYKDTPYVDTSYRVFTTHGLSSTNIDGANTFVCVKTMVSQPSGHIHSKLDTDFQNSPSAVYNMPPNGPNALANNLCSNTAPNGYASWDAYAVANLGAAFGDLCTDGFALPVTYEKQLTVVSSSYGVQLNWKTATEVNSQGFDVERSENGSAFEKIGYISAGNPNGSQYSFLDSVLPENAKRFYRLKHVDIDGKFTYSITVQVSKASGGPASTVYPNPLFSGDSFKINLAQFAEEVEVTVVSITGAIVDHKFYEPNGVAELSTRGYAPGQYFVKVRSSDITETHNLTIR